MINEFLHTYNRGTEKRIIFLDKQDYFRAVHDIYEFNNVNTAANFSYRFRQQKENYQSPTLINEKSKSKPKTRNLLINLYSWALMPNHYHFFSRDQKSAGISKFHQKWGTGYTKYFNIRYDRNGVLFQGKYKRVAVIDDAQAAHLICYIHSNLLDLWKPNWKKKGITNFELQNAIKFLNNKKNRWSSHQDYWGIKNFPSVISREFVDEFFGGSKGYRNFFISWLKQYEDNINSIQKFILD